MAKAAAFTAPPHPAQRPLILAKNAGAPAVNCTCAYTIRGPLDPDQLADAYRAALTGFDALRITWEPHTSGGQWRGVPQPRIAIHREDLRDQGLSHGGEPSSALHPRLRQATDQALDLACGPLAVIEILRIDTDLWTVTETIDHTVADGRSLTLLHATVADHYRTPGPRTSACPSYQALLADRRPPGAAGLDFWRRTFDGYEHPALTRHPPTEAATWRTSVSAADAARLHQAAGRARSTIASVLLAAHAHAVARHSGTGDLATFAAVDGRDADALDVFGHLTALLPARIRHPWHTGLGAHVATVTRHLLSLREHAEPDIDDLDGLGVPVAITRPDATAFVIQSQADPLIDLPGTTVRALRMRSVDQAGGLVTVATRHPGGAVDLAVRAPAGSAFAEHATSVGETIKTFLYALITDPDTPLGSDQLLPEADRGLINQVATPAAPYPFEPVDREIVASLAAAGRTPVLEDLGRTYTAAELHEKITRLLPALRAAEVTDATPVSVGNLDTIDRIAAFLAVLRLNAVYVPFDTLEDPTQVESLEQRCQAAARITRAGVHRLRTPPTTGEPIASGAHAPAYVIFTSGTTGEPKGVVVSRGALANLVRGESERFAIDAASRVLLIAPPVADPWICHVTAALLFRATLVRIDPHGDGHLADQIARTRVTHAFLPAALVRLIADTSLPDLRMLATAGDHCRAADLTGFTRQRVFNIYGPTEATVTATVAEVTETTDPVPIGTPIRGTGVRVLIDGAVGAPLGAPGELVLSGAGIALGYLDDPELTRTRFPPDPRTPQRRCYRTGDRGYLRPDGQLVVTGRMDRQAKIRGTRVELPAVEGAALATGGCTDAYADAFTPTGSPETRLALFVAGCTDLAALTDALHRQLPRSAWPHRIVALDSLPRRTSGKIAEDQLPLGHHRSETAERATTGLGALAAAWAEVLGSTPRQDDDFFAAGGDSLNVLRLVRHARAAGVLLSPADVYRHPRYRDLSQWCAAATAPDTPGPRIEPHRSLTIPFGPAQHWFLAMPLANPQAWQHRHTIAFPLLPTARQLGDALTALLAATPALRTAADIENRMLRVLPAEPVTVGEVDASLDDHALRESLAALHAGVDPQAGIMLRALALRQPDGAGLLVLAAHHLVVDAWSWDILTDRLHRILNGEHVATDHGFAAYATAVHRQTQAGAFTLDASWWQQVLDSGRTADLQTRTQRLQRLSIGRRAPADLASARRWPVSRLLPAALGHALAATEGEGATVVDVERNGRTAIAELDLSAAIGWIALHHPLTLAHAPLTVDSVARIAADLDEAPDLGLSYAALRWASPGALGGWRIGRFALDIRSGPSQREQAVGGLASRIRSLAPPPAGSGNALPYEATFSFLQQDDQVRAVMNFDPARIEPGHAAALLETLAAAIDTQPPRATRRGNRPSRRPVDETVPASAMQQLMLRHAATGPARYRPRQLIRLGSVQDAPALLDALRDFLSAFDPFRLRFETHGGMSVQRWLLGTDRTPIRTESGGLAAAHAWLDSPDRVDAAEAAEGGALVDTVAFPTDDALLIGMEVHHAAMDGVSNRILLQHLDRLAATFPDSSLTAKDSVSFANSLSSTLSRRVVRKHVACELAHGLRPAAVTPPHPADAGPPAAADLDVPAAALSRIGTWARRHGVDTRAALAAIVAEAAHASADIRSLQVVTNGRDADIPGSATALGMFWYLRPIPLDGAASDRAAAARSVYAAAAPLDAVRETAAHWEQWPSDAISFNYTKQGPTAPGSSLQILGSRDVFHFPAQVDAAISPDSSARIRCTVLGLGKTAERLRDELADRLS